MSPSPKLTGQEKRSIENSFGSSSQYQGIETNPKIILTHVLNSWNENKSSAHTSTCAFASAETVDMKIYSIELK